LNKLGRSHVYARDMTHKYNSSSATSGSNDSDKGMVYRPRGQSGKKRVDDWEGEDPRLQLKKHLSSGGSFVEEINTIETAFEDALKDSEDAVKMAPHRNFEVGPRPENLRGRKNDFIRTGVIGTTVTTPRYKPDDRASTILMKPGIGSAMRREDTRYGQNLVSCLSNRGLITGRRILVLGSGCASSMVNIFSRAPASVLCIDSDYTKVEVLSGQIRDAGMESVATALLGDATDPGSYSIVGERFDLILITKAFGAILSSTNESPQNLISKWIQLLSSDGVLAIDTQTVGHQSLNGRVSGCFTGEDVDIATVFGRYDDIYYDLDSVSEDLGLVTRERINIAVRGTCGKKGEELLEYVAQMWVMYLMSPSPRTLVPVVPGTAMVMRDPVVLSGGAIELAGGADLLPEHVRGSKVVPWYGVGDVVSRDYIYPKFDGRPGLLYFSSGQLTFVGNDVTIVKSAPFSKTEYCFLAEACDARLDGGEISLIFVILGITLIGGVTYDPNDMRALQSERPLFERKLLSHGVIVTNPGLMLSLRSDSVRVPAEYSGSRTYADIPVDGLNVSIGGMYGNFLKPRPLCTIDIENDQEDDIIEAMSIAMIDGVHVELVKESGVFEYKLEGDCYRPVRPRPDKKKGATTVRLAQDMAAAEAANRVFVRGDTVWELYNTLVSKMTMYRKGRAERQKFFD